MSEAGSESAGINKTAIEYEEDDRDVIGFAAWRVLEHFGGQADAEILDGIRRRMPIALRDFPALAHETINVGLLYEGSDALAKAYGYNRLICLPPDELTTNITLWHELGHVAIRVRHERDEPVSKSSEEFCSIYSVARMHPRVIDEDRIPYLGRPGVDRMEWPEICQRALEYREERGVNSHYIKKCKEWLEI